MEEKIRRGQVLREVLKQQRLTPQSPEFQLAWMMAYNAGRLDDQDFTSIHRKLAKLAEGLQRFPIDLSASREEWNQWLDLRLTGLGDQAG